MAEEGLSIRCGVGKPGKGAVEGKEAGPTGEAGVAEQTDETAGPGGRRRPTGRQAVGLKAAKTKE